MTRSRSVCLWMAPAMLVAASAAPPAAGQVVQSGTGANAAALLPTVNLFRTDLGAQNPNVIGIQNGGAGRREINWDGAAATLSAPNNFPANFFNTNSPRGATFVTLGSGFQVSGATTDVGAGQPAAANFGHINPTYTATFQPFSPQRLFAAVGNNALDVIFSPAGGPSLPGLTRGFGAVFSDVDLANTTSLQFFNAAGTSLGTFFAPTLNGGLSFLGVSFPTAVVGRVRVTNGNAALGAGVNDGGAIDVVTVDDFFYAEPVPEPSTLALLGIVAAGAGGWRWRRRKRG